jgi:4a-hydroxytetrahydrobiopterin dehydratase
MGVLSDTEIAHRLSGLGGWRRHGDSIVREFECGDFVGSTNFVAEMVRPAEDMGHHPDLEISWDKVTGTHTTHSEGGLTEAHVELAATIDDLSPNH